MIRNDFDREADSERPPLRFHSVHSGSIKLEQYGFRATRPSMLRNGIVFSDRPISIDERVSIRQAEISQFSAGGLRFGVTSIDPASLSPSELLGGFNHLKRSGYWINAVTDRFPSRGSVLQFFVSPQGDIHYSINGSSEGIFLRGVNTTSPLWVIADVYGRTMAIDFETQWEAGIGELMWAVRQDMSAKIGLSRAPILAPGGRLLVPSGWAAGSGGSSADERGPAPPNSVSSGERGADSLLTLPRELAAAMPGGVVTHPPTSVSTQVTSSSMNRSKDFDRGADSERRPDLKFHSVHSGSIKLEQFGRRVVRSSTAGSGIVFSNRPISIDERVSIRQAQITTHSAGGLRFGVTSIDPSSLDPFGLLGEFTHSERSGYWIGSLTDRFPSRGSVLQFFVSPQGEIHYSINGASKGIFLRGVNTSIPLWVIVDVGGRTMAIDFENETEAKIGDFTWTLRQNLSSRRDSAPTKSGGVVTHPPTSAPTQMTSSSMNRSPTASSSIVTGAKAPSSGVMRLEQLSKTMASLDGTGIPLAPIIASFTQRHPCAVCTSGAVNTVIYNCGHTCMCYECAAKIKGSGGGCPICRKPIADIVKTFD